MTERARPRAPPGSSRRCPRSSTARRQLQLFRFSAATGNAHRIHYDEAYARAEGHDGLVVQSTLRGQQLLNVVLRWLGDRGEVTAFSWRNLRPSHAGERVVCRVGHARRDRGRRCRS